LSARPAPSALGWRGWLGLAAALFVLNLSLSFQQLAPTPFVTLGHQLSVEIAVLVLGLALWRGLAGPPPAALLAVLAVVLTLLALGRYALVAVAGLLGRPLSLVWDLPHLPNVVAMLVETMPGWATAATAAGVLVLPLLVYAPLRWALGRVRLALEPPRLRRALGAGAAGLLLVYLVGPLSPSGASERWFAEPVSTAFAEQARGWQAARSGGGPSLAQAPEQRSDLARLGGAHLVVLFLESYGAVVYDRPGLHERLAPAREGLSRALAETGREAVSALVHAPTYGGYSWLSHASLLVGIEVRDNDAYAQLLTEERETLVHRFARQGYRPLAMMPGLREDWPEGAFYGFAEIYGVRDLDYRGPELGWWRIPDQFAAARLRELELASDDGVPRFVFFPTISTHAPFRPTPPYEPDWTRVLAETPYHEEALAAALAVRPNFKDLTLDYADAMAYAFDWLAGWLRQAVGDELVLLIVGDHQPPASVGGREASNEVPVHLITDRRELLDALLAEGFRPGLTPERPALAAMHELHALLLRAFDSGRERLAREAGVDVPRARPAR